MFRCFIFSALLLPILHSCKNELIQDVKVSKELLMKYHGHSGGIYYVNDKLALNNKESHFVRFIIKGSEISYFEKRKESYSPSIAIDLFNHLSQKTISNNYGIEIVFDSIDFTVEKKYFFTMEDLEIVSYNIRNINELFRESIKENHIGALSYIDTSGFGSHFDSILKRLKNIALAVDSSKTLYSYYKHQNIENDPNEFNEFFEIILIFKTTDSNNITVNIACLPLKRKKSVIGVYF